MDSRFIILLIVICLLILSCGNQETRNKKVYENISIASSSDNNFESDDLIIKNRDRESPFNLNMLNKKNNEPIIALYLGAGLYRSFCFIKILQEFEKKKINFHILSGRGFGLLISALYGKYNKASMVEWEMFKFLKQVGGNVKPFSEKWKTAFKSNFKKVFKNSNIQNSTKTILLPIYDLQKKRLDIKRKGRIYPSIVSIVDSKIFLKDYLKEFSYLKKVSDITVYLDILGDQVIFSHDPGDVGVAFAEALESVDNLGNNIENSFTVMSDTIHLDSYDDIFIFQNACEKKGKRISDQLQVIISKWKKEKGG